MTSDREVLSLLDWRRRVAELYGEVRAAYRTDPAAARGVWARGRDRLLAAHPQSPLHEERRGDFQGVPLYDYDPQLAFTGHLDLIGEPDRLLVAGSDEESFAFLRIGSVALPVGRLDVYWLDAYGGGLFVPFRDATGGTETYGGGRYLLDTVKGADLGAARDGSLVFDFNFAYHPSCVYSPAWSCPLAPPGNRLDAPVRAGERLA
jgi:uncharacterized protein (DUF1684 family)